MTTKAQRQSRLHELADLIERVDGNRQFDYNHWAAVRTPGGRIVESAILVIDLARNVKLGEGGCDTIGCVAGWACVLGLEAGYRPSSYYADMTIPQYAEAYLGLSHDEGTAVFLGAAMIEAGFTDESDPQKVRKIVSGTEVAKMLRMVAEGEVDLT